MAQIIDFAKAKAKREKLRRTHQAEPALRYDLGISLVPEASVWDMMVAPTDYESRYQDLIEFEIPQEVLAEIIYREGRRAQLAERAQVAQKSFFWVVSNGEDEIMRCMARLAIARVDLSLDKLVNVSAIMSLLHATLPSNESRLKATYQVLSGALALIEGDDEKGRSHLATAEGLVAGGYEALILRRFIRDRLGPSEQRTTTSKQELLKLVDMMLLACDMEYLKFMPASR